MSNLHYPQFCALARAAEIIGERWTLLIIRELLLGPKRFGDLLDHLDGMSPTLLTARLTTLIDCNVVRRAVLPPDKLSAAAGEREHAALVAGIDRHGQAARRDGDDTLP